MIQGRGRHLFCTKFHYGCFFQGAGRRGGLVSYPFEGSSSFRGILFTLQVASPFCLCGLLLHEREALRNTQTSRVEERNWEGEGKRRKTVSDPPPLGTFCLAPLGGGTPCGGLFGICSSFSSGRNWQNGGKARKAFNFKLGGGLIGEWGVQKAVVDSVPVWSDQSNIRALPRKSYLPPWEGSERGAYGEKREGRRCGAVIPWQDALHPRGSCRGSRRFRYGVLAVGLEEAM